jgi:hypothetical protein
MPDTTSTTEPKREGPVARSIEQQTAKIPSDVFLWGALGAMGLSALLQGRGRKHTSLFVGQWVPVFLMFGLYNKIVKVHGSDQFDEEDELEPDQPQKGQQFQPRPIQPAPQPQPIR